MKSSRLIYFYKCTLLYNLIEICKILNMCLMIMCALLLGIIIITKIRIINIKAHNFKVNKFKRIPIYHNIIYQ